MFGKMKKKKKEKKTKSGFLFGSIATKVDHWKMRDYRIYILSET